MTQDEFYSILMQDIEYVFKTGFKLSPEMFIQTMSYASEQYQLLLKRIEELEAPRTCGGCRYYEEWVSALGKMGVGDCLHDIAKEIVCTEVQKIFCCSYYESKEIK